MIIDFSDHKTWPNSFIVSPDGQTREYKPANGRTFTLKELRNAIGGGYIEIVSNSSLQLERYQFVCDEDGLSKTLPYNKYGTLIYGNHSPVVGDILVCKKGMIE